MAFGKRPIEVISIDSDTSDDDIADWTAARHQKTRRRAEDHLAPIDRYPQVDPFAPNPWEADLMADQIPQHWDARPVDGHQQTYPGVDGARRSSSTPENGYNLPYIRPGSFGDLPDFEGDWDSEATRLRRIEDNLQRVIEIVPDVCREHARFLLSTPGNTLDTVIDQLISKEYPKEIDKRAAEQSAKQTTEEAERQSVSNPQGPVSTKTREKIIDVLKSEFNKVPVNYIRNVQREKVHLYPSYLALNEAAHMDPLPYGMARWRESKDTFDFAVWKKKANEDESVAMLEKQYHAAKNACLELNVKRRKDRSRERQEQKNLEEAKANGRVAECAACFDSCALNRMVQCTSLDCHFTCFDCMYTYIKSEVGMSRGKLGCPTADCDGTFVESQLRLVPDSESLVDEVSRLRQEHDLRAAGIEDVENCPFCDFKAVCPPVEINFEFECKDSGCEIVSCRKCKEKSHIPDTCEEAKRKRSKDAHSEMRHTIEEDMSSAVISKCNQCSRPFVKEFGCNKITCSCGNFQCYLCGINISADYSHFNGHGKCALHDKIATETRHAQDAEKAKVDAQERILRENPHLDREQLDVNFSDNVTNAHAGEAGGFAAVDHAANRLARRAQPPDLLRLYPDLMNGFDRPRLGLGRGHAQAQPPPQQEQASGGVVDHVEGARANHDVRHAREFLPHGRFGQAGNNRRRHDHDPDR